MGCQPIFQWPATNVGWDRNEIDEAKTPKGVTLQQWVQSLFDIAFVVCLFLFIWGLGLPYKNSLSNWIYPIIESVDWIESNWSDQQPMLGEIEMRLTKQKLQRELLYNNGFKVFLTSHLLFVCLFLSGIWAYHIKIHSPIEFAL